MISRPIKHALCALSFALSCASCAHATSGTKPANNQTNPTYADRDEVRQFIGEMVEKHGFPERELQRTFARARFQPSIVTAMTPLPRGQRSWTVYRGNFVNPARIEAGTRFWAQHAAALERASARYGVPPEIIAAIIGVETEYGRNMGSFRVVDALATLTFDYPRRAEFFRGELEQYLLLARETGADALALKGSYAGAIGIPQFMPGSLRRYAVDFDGDGRRDLRNSAEDAIGSVGNFLSEHGWARGEPIAFGAQVEGDAFRALVDGGVEANRRAAELREAGVRFDEAVGADTACVLIELESPADASVYLVGLHNFYVLTRYNRSSFYASAVLALAENLKAAVATSTTQH